MNEDLEKEIILCNDAEKRGVEKANFKIICNNCGRQRKFQFTKMTWDIMPCPYCKASGMTNEAPPMRS